MLSSNGHFQIPAGSAVVALLLCGDAALSLARAQVANPHLELQETSSIEVPDSFLLGGIFQNNAGLLLWSPYHSHLLVGGNKSGRLSELTSDHVIAPSSAVIVDSTAVKVLDRLDGSIVTIRVNGSAEKLLLDLGIRVRTAVSVTEGWFLEGVTNNGKAVLFFVSSDGAIRHSFTHQPAALRLLSRQGTLFGAGVTAFIVSGSAPFHFLELSPDGSVPNSWTLPDSLLFRSSVDDPLWKVVGIASIGEDLLVTLADIREDSRILLVVDHNGGIRYESIISAPISFIGTVADSSILAVRRIKSQEVVQYRWRWQTSDHER